MIDIGIYIASGGNITAKGIKTDIGIDCPTGGVPEPQIIRVVTGSVFIKKDVGNHRTAVGDGRRRV